jgi:hypothetical protein
VKKESKFSYYDFLQAVHHLMHDSLKAYNNYMQNGKTFLYAKELLIYNSSMMDLLTGNSDLLPDDLKAAAAALIEHYTIWRNKWDELEKEICPGPGDVFVFENRHVFPKWSALLLEEKYQEYLHCQ